MEDQKNQISAIFKRLGATEASRRMTAERIFRRLRRSDKDRAERGYPATPGDDKKNVDGASSRAR